MALLLTPAERDRLGEASADAIEAFRRPTLPAGLRYALLLREPRTRGQKPLALASLADLARTLHRRRAGAPLQLADTELLVQGDDRPRAGVHVWTLDPDTGDRRRLVGWAWLAGAGRLALEHALAAEQLEEVGS